MTAQYVPRNGTAPRIAANARAHRSRGEKRTEKYTSQIYLQLNSDISVTPASQNWLEVTSEDHLVQLPAVPLASVTVL